MSKIQLPEKYREFCDWSEDDVRKQVANFISEQKQRVIDFVNNPTPTIADIPVLVDSVESICYDLYDQMYLLALTSTDKGLQDVCRSATTELRQIARDILSSRDYAEALQKVDTDNISEEDQRLYEMVLLQVERAGQYLPEAKRLEYLSIQKKIDDLAMRFGKNLQSVLDIWVSKDELVGVPDSVIDGLENSGDKYRITTEYSIVIPILEYAELSETRKKAETMFGLRGGLENKKIFTDVMELRQRSAELLGYDNHAELKIKSLMVDSLEEIYSLMDQIEKYALPIWGKEKADLLALKRFETDDPQAELNSYDIPFYSRKLTEQRFGIDKEKLREYFSYDRAMSVMMEYFSELFQIDITRLDIDNLWSPEVDLYAVADGGEVLGYIAFDMLPRDLKHKHPCAAPVITAVSGGGPSFSAIIANFRRPTAGMPRTLDFSEARTLFHEFGHVLHNTLGRSQHNALTGFRTAWDFIEVPSQLIEQFVYDEDVLGAMAIHHGTGEVLPKPERDQLRASRYMMAGYTYLRQAALVRLDLASHTNSMDFKNEDISKYWQDLLIDREIPISSDSLFPASFGHLIVDEYDAAYYSYMYSLVYALDIYVSLQESGDKKAFGKKIREELLGRGGSRSEKVSAAAVLGRPVLVENFLRATGLREDS